MRASSILSAMIAALACAGACRADSLSPSNLPAGFCNDVVAGDVSLAPGGYVLDTDTDCTLVVPQQNGPELCVVRYHSLTFQLGAQLIASGSRPLVLSAQTDLTILGLVDASNAGSRAAGAELDASEDGAGGGGGGFGSAGGDGGSNGAGGFGTPGAPIAGSLVQIPLLGGQSGGHGSGTGAADGGKGGGALQLVACGKLKTGPQSVLRAIGRGGSGAVAQMFDSPNGGGGGGSGGALLLEGDVLELQGIYTANGGGGGGGGGGVSGSGAGQPGADGSESDSQALGGSANPGAGEGGLGGAKAGAPSNGADATDSGAGGGGGGAYGRIRLNRCTSSAFGAGWNGTPTPVVAQRCNILLADGFE